jgi:prepilin-type N-terminal cleavage/methylation domain-containing protein
MTVKSLSLNPGIRQRQAGYTLIELSISLAIIAVLLVGTLTGVQRLLRSNNANNTISTTQAALTNITKLYATVSEPSIYTTTNLINMGVWDSSAVTPAVGTTPAFVKHPFGGRINVAANTAAIGAAGVNQAAAGSGYWYRLGGIPSESCASVATSMQNTAAAIYVASATTAGGATPTGTNAGYKVPGANNVTANLAGACASADTVEISLFILS